MVRFIRFLPDVVAGLGLRRGIPRHLTVPHLVRSNPPDGWDDARETAGSVYDGRVDAMAGSDKRVKT